MKRALLSTFAILLLIGVHAQEGEAVPEEAPAEAEVIAVEGEAAPIEEGGEAAAAAAPLEIIKQEISLFDQSFNASHHRLEYDDGILMFTYYSQLSQGGEGNAPACLLFTLKDNATFIKSCNFDVPEFFVNGTQLYLNNKDKIKPQFEGLMSNFSKPAAVPAVATVENVTVENVTVDAANASSSVRRMLYRRLQEIQAEVLGTESLGNASIGNDSLGNMTGGADDKELDYFLLLYSMWFMNVTYDKLYDLSEVYYFLPMELNTFLMGQQMMQNDSGIANESLPVNDTTEEVAIVEEVPAESTAVVDETAAVVDENAVVAEEAATDVVAEEEVIPAEGERRLQEEMFSEEAPLDAPLVEESAPVSGQAKAFIDNIKGVGSNLMNISGEFSAWAGLTANQTLDTFKNLTLYWENEYSAALSYLQNKYGENFLNVTQQFFDTIEVSIQDEILLTLESGYDEIIEYREQILSVLPADAAILIDNIINYDQIVGQRDTFMQLISNLDMKLQGFYKSCIFYPDHFAANHEFLVFCEKSGLKELWLNNNMGLVVGNESMATGNNTFMKAIRDIKKKALHFLFEKDSVKLMQSMPAEQPIEEAPVEEAPVEEVPVEEVPAEEVAVEGEEASAEGEVIAEEVPVEGEAAVTDEGEAAGTVPEEGDAIPAENE